MTNTRGRRAASLTAALLMLVTVLAGSVPAQANQAGRPVPEPGRQIDGVSALGMWPASERAVHRGLREERTGRWRRACRRPGNQVCWTPRRHRAVVTRMHRWMERRLVRRDGANAAEPARYRYCRALPDCSCSGVSIDRHWYGLEWGITFDTAYTRRIPDLSGVGDLLALPGLGAQFMDRLTSVTKSRLAVLAVLGLAWDEMQEEAAKAAASGEQLRITAYSTWGSPFLPFFDAKTV